MSGTHPAGQLFELDRSRCLSLLATQQVGRLVGGNSDSPVVVVNNATHGHDIVVRVATGSPALRVGAAVASVDDSPMFTTSPSTTPNPSVANADLACWCADEKPVHPAV